jgi:thiol-disulfide isomerase/thioredoxin
MVVLDFWYRGCGWCIRAMPQLNAVADQFAGRPVAVLGMAIDQNEANAKFVCDEMTLDRGPSAQKVKRYTLSTDDSIELVDY